ncbi:MAG TPA: 2-phosphosulfolactate phosphatase [Methylomirabilota bacterium]|nr:2-phosphosulfolactate phosphatase [Methylomirabilota bacterium]
MRVDVAVTPGLLAPAGLAGATALVIDVLRASTSIVTALTHGCREVVPVAEVDDARRCAAGLPGALLAGERGGDPPAGFDLGNSPLEFTRERVAGRTIVFTTSNGTRALLAARAATAVGVAAFANLTAAADWALGQGRDVVIVCAGELGGRAVEDEVCAGLLVGRLLDAEARAVASPAAAAAAAAAERYAGDLAPLAEDAPHARRLTAVGRGGDVAACLRRDAFALVPLYRGDIDKVVSPYR